MAGLKYLLARGFALINWILGLNTSDNKVTTTFKSFLDYIFTFLQVRLFNVDILIFEKFYLNSLLFVFKILLLTFYKIFDVEVNLANTVTMTEKIRKTICLLSAWSPWYQASKGFTVKLTHGIQEQIHIINGFQEIHKIQNAKFKGIHKGI